MKKTWPENTGDSKKPALSVVENGTKTGIPRPFMRGKTWQDVRERLIGAYALLGHDPDDDEGERQVTGFDPADYEPSPPDRACERRALLRSATAEVKARPGIFAEWAAKAEKLARADE